MINKSIGELIKELGSSVYNAQIAYETICWGGKVDCTIIDEIIKAKCICNKILEISDKK